MTETTWADREELRAELTIADTMACQGFTNHGDGLYSMYLLGELLSLRVHRTPDGIVVRGSIIHRGQDDETPGRVQTAEYEESTETHGTIGDATEAAATMVAEELLEQTPDRATELLREATWEHLTEDLRRRYRVITLGFAVDYYDYLESPGLELAIVGVPPLVERAAVEPDVTLYPNDLTWDRIAELGGALAESIALWERGEL